MGNETQALNGYFEPIPPISVVTQSGTAPAQPVAVPLPATISEVDRHGQSIQADFSKMPVSSINIEFRTAEERIAHNGLHAYIDITRIDRGHEVHQILGALPAGGFPQTHEGGQLEFVAGSEKGQPLLRSDDLTVPRGLTKTEYADSLVAGAKAYNAQPVRYDGIGENGYNSNSWVSSLVVAKGHAAGLEDVKAIARDLVTSSPVTTDPHVRSSSDSQIALDVVRAGHEGKFVATGFGHASISPARFREDSHLAPEAVPGLPQASNAVNAAPALAESLERSIVKQFREATARSGFGTAPTPDPTYPPYVLGAGVKTRSGGVEHEVGPGFHRDGIIESVRGNVVTQRTSNGTIEYSLHDLRERAPDPTALDRMLEPGRRVHIAIDEHSRVEVDASQISRGHELGRGHGIGR